MKLNLAANRQLSTTQYMAGRHAWKACSQPFFTNSLGRHLLQVTGVQQAFIAGEKQPQLQQALTIVKTLPLRPKPCCVTFFFLTVPGVNAGTARRRYEAGTAHTMGSGGGRGGVIKCTFQGTVLVQAAGADNVDTPLKQAWCIVLRVSGSNQAAM